MSYSSVNTIKKYLKNMPGWRTKRRIVAIESDDWGMVRMASKKVYNWFLNKGYNVNECPYNSNDAIESNTDVELLFDVLSSVQDRHGNPAVITANNIVANPDFNKIRESGFQEYYFEPFTETLKKYPGRDRVLELCKQGIDQKIFCPQFHGREHINVNRWMAELNNGNKVVHDAFDKNMVTVHKSGNISGRRDNLDAFGMEYDREWVSMREVIKTGLDLFEEIWGFRSASFIAPCYVWPFKIEEILNDYGVYYLQGTHVQQIPAFKGRPGISKKYHYMGQENRLGQRYLVRNVHFEPTENGRAGILDKVLKEIEIAFQSNKPAIISSHRVNYMGSINPENREANLKLLASLLQQIVKHYPDVEFMSSDQIGSFITKDH